MARMSDRIKRVAESLMGNESLLQMVEGNAASELLAWGLDLANRIVKGTRHLGEDEAESAMGPRLHALRQLLRSVGNWAAGQYAQPEARRQLRDHLVEQFGLILGQGPGVPTPEQLDRLLQQAEGGALDAGQRIANLHSSIEELLAGGPHAQA